MATFNEDQVLRLMELAAYEASGTVWGCGAIASTVLKHYDDEDGKMKAYVDENEGDIDGFDMS